MAGHQNAGCTAHPCCLRSSLTTLADGARVPSGAVAWSFCDRGGAIGYARSVTRLLWTRIVFSYVALQSSVVGFWALLAPQSFYDDFPGSGRSWVSVDGPFNEHLVRDVGALNLALLVLVVAAASRPTRELVVVAAVASLIWGVPHLVYHAFNTGGLAGGDVVANVGGLAAFVVLPLTVLLFRPDPVPLNAVTQSD